MLQVNKNFSIDDVHLFKDDDNVDFALAEIYFLSDGNNKQDCPIPTEVLRRDAKTVLGKFIVAKYNKWNNDAEGHELDEVIIGYCPSDSQLRFVEKDGKLFAVCDAVISKIYATEIYNLFKSKNFRSVSAEFSCFQDDTTEYGEGTILGFNIHSICVLGLKINPAVDGANIQIKKFSEKEANEYYLSINENKENKEDNMEDNKQMSDEKENVIMSKETETQEEQKELSENIEASKETFEEQPKEEVEQMEENPQEDDKDDDDKDDTKDDEKEMSEESTESFECGNKEDVVVEESCDKKFSLEKFAEFEETEDEFENKVLKEMSAKEIFDTIVSFSKENKELKEFKEERLTKDRDCKLASIMSSVKDDLETKQFSELQEEGQKLSLDELGGFENKVKAFAYESSKGKRQKETEQEDIMRFAGSTTQETTADETADDIFNKYL